MISLALHAEIPVGDVTDGCDVDKRGVLWFVQRTSPLPEFGFGAPVSPVHEYHLMSVGLDGVMSTRGGWKRTARISPFGVPDFAVHSDGLSFIHRVTRDSFRWERVDGEGTYRSSPAVTRRDVELPGVEAIALLASGILFLAGNRLSVLENDCTTLKPVSIELPVHDDETDVSFVRGGDAVALVTKNPRGSHYIIFDEEAHIVAQGSGILTDIRGGGSDREWLVLCSGGAEIRTSRGSRRALPFEYPLDDQALFFSPPVLCTGDIVAVFGEEGHVWQWTTQRAIPPVQSLRPNSTNGFQWVRARGDWVAVFEQGRALLFHR